MFMILVVILTIISISLRIFASSLELAAVVSKRIDKNKNNSRLKKKDFKEISGAVARFTLATSASLMRLSAFIVSRVRDLVSVVGSLVGIIDVIVFLIVVICSSAYISLYADVDDGGSGIYWRNDLLVGSSNTSSSSSNSSSSTVSKPKGISDESWNSADDIGKKVVAFACSPVFNPPNGKPLIYLQGNTGIGYADCSTFVCGVLEGSLNKTFSGINAPNGYDFSKNRKSDLKGYMATSAMWSHARRNKTESIVGTVGTSRDKLRPGDILVTKEKGHVVIYVGKNTAGKHIIVHASSDDPVCFDNIELSGDKYLNVGFNELTSYYNNMAILRTSVLVK